MPSCCSKLIISEVIRVGAKQWCYLPGLCYGRFRRLVPRCLPSYHLKAEKALSTQVGT